LSEQHRPAPIDGYQTDLTIDVAKANELQFFPSHPWSVRAVWEIMGPLIFDTWPIIPDGTVLYDPCAGLGHIVEPLREMFPDVRATDIHDWGKAYPLADGLAFEADPTARLNIAFMNPPFDKPKKGMAELMIRQAQKSCPHVIALCRLSFLSSTGRHALHHENPLGNLRHVFPLTERAPMQLGKYNPKCDKPQEYAWFHYQRGFRGYPQIINIAPGAKARHYRESDIHI